MAIRNDLEFARRVRDQEQQGRAQRQPPGVDGRVWTPERAILTDIADIQLEIRALLQAQLSQRKPQQPQRMPRPRSARERLEIADAYERHRTRVARMVPKRRR